MKIDNATFGSWSIRLLSAALLTTLVACRYQDKAVDASVNIDNTVDYVIAGNANLAAHGFAFPLQHSNFEPLVQI